jgi:hypothetical protein
VGDVIKATKGILGLLEDLSSDERGRVMGLLLALQGEGITVTLGSPQAGPPAQERRKPGRPRKSAADPKGSEEPKRGRGRKKNDGSRCPDHREKILQLLAKGPMKTSDLLAKLGIEGSNTWEWRVNIVALQQAKKVTLRRAGSETTWSLA